MKIRALVTLFAAVLLFCAVSVRAQAEEAPVGPSPLDAEAISASARAAQERAPKYRLNKTEHVAYIAGSKDLFRPNDNLSRAEAAKIIYALLEEIPDDVELGSFSDVPDGVWYTKSVRTLAGMGILKGYGKEFRPQGKITRAELVTILSRFFEPVSGDVAFPDISLDHWAYQALATGVAKGWINGYKDGTLRPDSNVTRAEAVTILNRVLGRAGDRERLTSDGNALVFLDLPFTHWAYYNVMEASLAHTYDTDPQSGKEAWLSYELGKAEHAPGMHSVNGELYCVDDDGHFVRNVAVGVLNFDDTGRHTTGIQELDEQLTKIVLSFTAPGDSRYDVLRKLYRHMCDDFSYLANRYIDDGETGWEPEWALQMVTRGKGNCYNYAALFTVLAQRMGYQATGRSGSINMSDWGSDYWSRHGWVQIELDGKTCLCDPEFEGVYIKDSNLNIDLFMRQYSAVPVRYLVRGKILS